MSFCPSCGTTLTPGALHCTSCGAAVATPGATPGATAVVAVPTASAGLSNNAAGALAYLAGLITGILFLVLEPFKNQPFVRFHAFQSIFFHIAWIAFWIAWSIVGLILTALTKGLFAFLILPVNLLILIGGICLWIFLMYSAYQNKTIKLPIIGALAAKQAGL